MWKTLPRNLAFAFKAGFYAFNRALQRGESFGEIFGYSDPLTGLPNRRAFEEERPTVPAFSNLMLIDIERLHSLNESLGYCFGNEIICTCAEILKKASEKVGKSYRLSGDRFAVTVPQCWTEAVTCYVRGRVKDDSRFTVSIGISAPCGNLGISEEILVAAESDLYKVKSREPDLYSEFLTDNSQPESRAPSELHIIEAITAETENAEATISGA